MSRGHAEVTIAGGMRKTQALVARKFNRGAKTGLSPFFPGSRETEISAPLTGYYAYFFRIKNIKGLLN